MKVCFWFLIIVFLNWIYWPLENSISLPLQLHGILHRLGSIGAPTVLMQLITFMMLSMGSVTFNLDAVEYFAGEQAVSRPQTLSFVTSFLSIWLYVAYLKPLATEVTGAWAGNGFRVAPFEIKLDPLMDILSVPGCLNRTTFRGYDCYTHKNLSTYEHLL